MEEKEELIKEKRQNTNRVLAYIALVFSMLGISANITYITRFIRDYLFEYNQELVLEFFNDEITLEYKDKFNPENYIKNISNAQNIVVDYPVFTTDQLGKYNAEYQISNSLKSIKKELVINVVDSTPPVIELSKKEIELTRDVDEFNPMDNVSVLSDNYDQEPQLLIDELDWSLDDQILVYKAIDSSGNESVAELNIIYKNKPVVKPPAQPKKKEEPATDTGSSYTEPTSPPATPSIPQPPSPPSSQPFINGVHDISVSVNSSINDVIFALGSGISASGNVTIDYSSVNTGVPGIYSVYYYGSDGANASCSVTVHE